MIYKQIRDREREREEKQRNECADRNIKTAVCLDIRAFKEIESVVLFVSQKLHSSHDLSTVKFAVNEARQHCRSVVTVFKGSRLHAMSSALYEIILRVFVFSLVQPGFSNTFYHPTI